MPIADEDVGVSADAIQVHQGSHPSGPPKVRRAGQKGGVRMWILNLGREAPSRPVRACARTLELESHRAVVKRGLVQARAEAVALAPLLFAPRVSGGMADAIPARLAHVRAVGRALAHNVLLFARVGRERDVRLRCRWPLTDVPRRCWNALKCISSTECRHTASLACSP
eukprot:scaffold100712_cov31-Tisochrysis_lutea.AAC.4